jgi:hypothetical protein
MGDKLIKLLLLKLKVMAVVLMLALVSLFTFSFTTSRRLADDIWKQLGMNKEQGTTAVKESFMYGYLSYYGAKNARNIATGNRAAIAKDLLSYTKQYVNSEVFRKGYDLERKQAKPEEPVSKVRTKEAIHKQLLAETEKSIKDSEEIGKLSADMAKAVKPSIELFKKQLIEYKDPNNKMVGMLYENDLREREDQLRSYRERFARWEKEYPADYRNMIKTRLQRYLDLSATVDFMAELKQEGKKKKFVNPTYEGKAYDWKQVYRAGKDVYDVAKPFAEQWIKELGVK